MPTRRLPNTVPTVLRCLTTAREQYQVITIPADRAIPVTLFAKLDPVDPTSLLNRLIKEDKDVDLALGAQIRATNGLLQYSRPLAVLVSHFHQVLDLAISRGYFTNAARTYYKREANATTIPDVRELAALDEAALSIINGEPSRQAAEGAGFQPMALPSVDEVSVLHDDFAAARAASKAAQEHTDLEREHVSALLPEAIAVCLDIYDTVEFFYRKDPDPASRRAKCARWGLVYVYGAGEVPPVPEQADIFDITLPGPGQVHFHYSAVNAATFDVWHKAPGAAAFTKVADNVEATTFQSSGLAVGAHEFKVVGRNESGAGPESDIAVVQVN